MNFREFPAILAFLLLVSASIVIYKFTDVPSIWAFLGLGCLGWLVLHIYTSMVQKEIDKENKNIIFDIDPASEIIEREQFSSPLRARLTVEGENSQLVSVHQKIITREHIFIGYRNPNKEDGVCLENQLEYIE